jgi:hypothetical protein
MGYTNSILLSQIEPGLDWISSQQNPFKNIVPSGRLEGNATQRVYCVVSPEIALWVVAILMCLQLDNERRSAVVLCNIYSFSITSNHNIHSIHACGIPDLTS